MIEPSYPGAVAPERSRTFVSSGLRLRLREWGDPARAPVVLCHGMFDHGRGFDLLAPRLAERFRVIAIDARGHGDSEWADAYLWASDLLDLANVLASLGRPAHLIGHSRGGGQATDTAARCPELVGKRIMKPLTAFTTPRWLADGATSSRIYSMQSTSLPGVHSAVASVPPFYSTFTWAKDAANCN